MYRLQVKRGGKWRTGQISYTKEAAQLRREQMISTYNLNPNNIRIKSENELFN